MARLLGVDIPNRKKIEYSLRYFTALAYSCQKGTRRNGYRPK